MKSFLFLKKDKHNERNKKKWTSSNGIQSIQ